MSACCGAGAAFVAHVMWCVEGDVDRSNRWINARSRERGQ